MNEEVMNTEEQSNASRKPKTEKIGRSGFIRLAVAGAALLVVAGVVLWFHSRNLESTDDAFIDGNIVPVNSRVAGIVDKILVSDNQDVHAGDTLVLIDQKDLKAQRDSADAALAVAQASLESAKAKSLSADSEVTAADAEYQRRKSDLRRYQNLDPRVVSKQQFDAARAEAESAEAKLRAAENVAAAAKAFMSESQARIRQAQAQVEQSELALSYTEITAAVSGRVTKKTVQPGQYLEVGQMLMTIVPDDVWVVANFKETQLADMRRGQPAEITVDAYPGVTFRGKVESVQAGSGARFSLLPPENATGNYVKVVQRVPVKILIDPGSRGKFLLGPGMSAVPTVNTAALPDEPQGVQSASAE
jgi:membrane fusion protein (multidrug efflux system)